jgi:hypothetical protein
MSSHQMFCHVPRLAMTAVRLGSCSRGSQGIVSMDGEQVEVWHAGVMQCSKYCGKDWLRPPRRPDRDEMSLLELEWIM